MIGNSKNIFWLENVKPGVYQFQKITRSTVANTHIIKFNDKNAYSFKIKKPGIHYIGAFKLKYINKGLFKVDEASLTKIRKPESELLPTLLQLSKETRWAPMIKRRMKKLKRKKK
jgi:hypothetical protein